ncbi:hypothetical protein F4802DRAFT_435916 [Xylaria palmicola]|nr:hypothetical protein F4802DRAFT_435916 [Xylaria palmicola]
MLGYIPAVIAFVLWIIDDCSRLCPGAPRLLPWWKANIDSERCIPCCSHTMLHGSRLSSHGSIGSGFRVDDNDVAGDDYGDDASLMGSQDSLLLRYMWSPSPSCVPSSRLSDISLSSAGLESLPSSWGTMTRIWFPDFSNQGQTYGGPSHTGCRGLLPSRSVRGNGPSEAIPLCHRG